MNRKDTGNILAPRVKEIFARNLRTLRVRAGQSQDHLSEDSGLDRTYVSQLERGLHVPSLEIVARAAHALGVTIAALSEGIERSVAQAVAEAKPAVTSRGVRATARPYAGPTTKKDIAYLKELGVQAGLTLKSKKYLGAHRAHLWVCAAGREVRTNTGNLRQRMKNEFNACTRCSAMARGE